MLNKFCCKTVIAGICAGAVNGLFGAGGGMLLLPMLTWLTPIPEQQLFPTCVSIVLPVCIVSLLAGPWNVDLAEALPYLLGSAAGGIFAGFLGKKLPVLWLHRIFGAMILWGGIRSLCR